MLIVNKYMLFSVLVITSATSFASGVEQETTAGQGAAVEWLLPQPAMPQQGVRQEGVQQAGRIASFTDQAVARVNRNHTFLSVAAGLRALPANPALVAQGNEAPAAEEFDVDRFFA